MLKRSAIVEMSALLNFGRLDSTRVLAFGGIGFVLLGLLLGEIYAIYISHVANGIIGRTWSEIIAGIASGDSGVLTESFPVIEDLTAKRGRTMNTHSHLGGYGLLALVLAYVQPHLRLEPEAKRTAAIMFLTGAGVHVLGVYVSYYVADWTLYLADIGALIVIVACLRMVFAFRMGGEALPMRDQLMHQLEPRASGFLLRAGLLLTIIGTAFGLYYAWVLVSQDEPALFGAIDQAAAIAAEGDAAEARAQMARFKAMQSKVAITAAAHSHAVEFGFLMVLLALLQRFVMLSERWRLNWARVLAVGAFALPVCVLLATRYGLRAAAFSDLFGSFVIIGLGAMAFGVIRYTGSADGPAGATS